LNNPIIGWIVNNFWGIVIITSIASILGWVFVGFNWLGIMGWSFNWTPEQQELADKAFNIIGYIDLFTSIISFPPVIARRVKNGKWF